MTVENCCAATRERGPSSKTVFIDQPILYGERAWAAGHSAKYKFGFRPGKTAQRSGESAKWRIIFK